MEDRRIYVQIAFYKQKESAEGVLAWLCTSRYLSAHYFSWKVAHFYLLNQLFTLFLVG
jgi:poly(3-hydroxyalkanoate) synthetase